MNLISRESSVLQIEQFKLGLRIVVYIAYIFQNLQIFCRFYEYGELVVSFRFQLPLTYFVIINMHDIVNIHLSRM